MFSKCKTSRIPIRGETADGGDGIYKAGSKLPVVSRSNSKSVLKNASVSFPMLHTPLRTSASRDLSHEITAIAISPSSLPQTPSARPKLPQTPLERPKQPLKSCMKSTTKPSRVVLFAECFEQGVETTNSTPKPVFKNNLLLDLESALENDENRPRSVVPKRVSTFGPAVRVRQKTPAKVRNPLAPDSTPLNAAVKLSFGPPSRTRNE